MRRAEHSRLATKGPPKRRSGPRECVIRSEWQDVLNLWDEKGQVNYRFSKWYLQIDFSLMWGAACRGKLQMQGAICRGWWWRLQDFWYVEGLTGTTGLWVACWESEAVRESGMWFSNQKSSLVTISTSRAALQCSKHRCNVEPRAGDGVSAAYGIASFRNYGR